MKTYVKSIILLLSTFPFLISNAFLIISNHSKTNFDLSQYHGAALIYNEIDPEFNTDNEIVERYVISETKYLPHNIEDITEVSGIEPIDPPFNPDIPVINIAPPYIGVGPIPYTNQETYAYNYFLKLDDNKPTNNVGNCGYVAISMLLEYYDNMWSDTIIDEKYDKKINISTLQDSSYYQSPGINDIYEFFTDDDLDKEDPGYESELNERYRTYLDVMLNNGSFIGQLYRLGIETGHINYLDESVLLGGIGVSYDVVKDVLAAYVKENDIDAITKSDYAFHSNKDIPAEPAEYKRIRDGIIEKVSAGQPVILGGTLSGGGGHDVVAYYYDDENDILYGNMGWGREKNFVNLDTGFAYIEDYFWIDIKPTFNHTHTNNYYKSNESLSNKCSCDLESHTCNLLRTFPYTAGGDTWHVTKCICNRNIKYSKHTYEQYLGSKRCSICRHIHSEVNNV